MIEPARTDRNVSFPYRIHITIWVTMVEVFVFHIVCDVGPFDFMPYRVACYTSFISDPANACRLSREDSNISFSFFDVFEPFIKGIGYFLGTATTCTVHPNLDKFPFITVFRITKDFFQLVEIVLVVFFFSCNMVFWMIGIPWG